LQKTKARLERAKLVGRGARARGRDDAAICGAALNDALYRASEASLEEIEHEVLRGAFP
jgi:hypothetical protein